MICYEHIVPGTVIQDHILSSKVIFPFKYAVKAHWQANPDEEIRKKKDAVDQ